MSTEPHSALSLTLTRRFDAPPERVFDAWLVSAWAEWLPPVGAHCKVTILEPRVGGRYQVHMTMSDGRSVNISGRYLEVSRPGKLVFSWVGDYNNQETLITVTFKADATGTLMTFQQDGFGEAGLRDGYRQGWSGTGGSFDKLAQHLSV